MFKKMESHYDIIQRHRIALAYIMTMPQLMEDLILSGLIKPVYRNAILRETSPIKPSLLQKMAWCKPGTMPYLVVVLYSRGYHDMVDMLISDITTKYNSSTSISTEQLCMLNIGQGFQFVAQRNRAVQFHLREYEQYKTEGKLYFTKKGVTLSLTDFFLLRNFVREIDEVFNNRETLTDTRKWYLTSNIIVSVGPKYPTVDIRKFFELNEQLQATRAGASLNVEMWGNVKSALELMPDFVPEISDFQCTCWLVCFHIMLFVHVDVWPIFLSVCGNKLSMTYFISLVMYHSAKSIQNERWVTNDVIRTLK